MAMNVTPNIHDYHFKAARARAILRARRRAWDALKGQVATPDAEGVRIAMVRHLADLWHLAAALGIDCGKVCAQGNTLEYEETWPHTFVSQADAEAYRADDRREAEDFLDEAGLACPRKEPRP